MKIKDLFELNKEFRNFDYICGQNGSENEILNIEITEVPDGVYWVKEGDFIITTGYFIKKDEMSFENFIKMLIYHKASGLGIKVGRFIEEIPLKIIKIAENNNFPIISIPINMRYSNILSPVAFSLNDSQQYDYFTINRYKSDLKKTIKHNIQKDYSINIITELMFSYLGFPIGVFWGNNYKKINTDEDKIFEIMEMTLKNEFSHSKITECGYTSVPVDQGKLLYFNIEAVNQTIAHLCIFIDINCAFKETDLKIIEESLPMISIYLLSDPNKNLKYYKDIDEFYMSIIQGDYVNNEIKLREDASYLDIDYEKNRLVWSVEISDCIDYDSKRLKNTIKSFLDYNQNEYFLIEKRKRLIYIFTNKLEQISPKFVLDYFIELVNRISFSHKDLLITIGVSKNCKNLKYLNLAHDEAIFANKFGKKIHPGNKIYFYDDYMVYHLLYEISSHPNLTNIYRNTIERIVKFDRNNNSNLYLTVLNLIDYDFNINQTASSLFIHRNTLYKRINKINNLLDMDIDKSESRLILQLAVKLKKILD